MCPGCGRHFRNLGNLKRHRGACKPSTKKQFHYDHYQPSRSIFERLECEGIVVDKDIRYTPWFACFDCEAILEPLEYEATSTKYIQSHQLVAISVSSNIDGFREPKCFVDADPNRVITETMKYWIKIKNEARKLCRNRFSEASKQLDSILDNCPESSKKRIGKLRRQFDDYLDTLVRLGYNSSRYDMQILRPYLFPLLRIGSKSDEISNA